MPSMSTRTIDAARDGGLKLQAIRNQTRWK
jgi:hypothetical protein